MHTLVTILHILACLILIMIVLLQAGKGANMGAAFGGSSQTVFGSSGAGTFLGKMTAAVAYPYLYGGT
jgi:preprotein translocase subunit SecG